MLYSEYQSYSTAVRGAMFSMDKFAGLATTIGVAGATIAYDKQIYLIVVLLPLFEFGVAFYAIHIGCEVMALGGYRRWLEEELNYAYREQLFVWETKVAAARHTSAPLWVLRIFYAVGLLVFSAVSIATMYTYTKPQGAEPALLPEWLPWAVWPTLLVCLGAAIAGLVHLTRAGDRAYGDAKAKA